jgi:predicted Fe-Mo cluster-binding NifX family protein
MTPTAITAWNGIISPVFDAADTFLIMKDGEPEEVMRMAASSPLELAGELRKKNVTVVICGAISAVPLRLLVQNGITVIPWIRGDVKAVVEAYRRGTLYSRHFLMPGCIGRGRMCGRNQWRRGPGRCFRQ